MALRDQLRAPPNLLGVRIVEMKVSAANDNARDAKAPGMDTAEYKRGGATGWRSRAAAVGSGVGRTAEGNAALGEDSAGWAAIATVALATIVLVLVTLGEAASG